MESVQKVSNLLDFQIKRFLFYRLNQTSSIMKELKEHMQSGLLLSSKIAAYLSMEGGIGFHSVSPRQH